MSAADKYGRAVSELPPATLRQAVDAAKAMPPVETSTAIQRYSQPSTISSPQRSLVQSGPSRWRPQPLRRLQRAPQHFPQQA